MADTAPLIVPDHDAEKAEGDYGSAADAETSAADAETRLDRIFREVGAEQKKLKQYASFAAWVCLWQILLASCMMVLFFARRSPLLLLVDPLYIGAAIVGYMGASQRKELLILCHIMGVLGLTFVFVTFTLLQVFAEEGGRGDMIVLAIHSPVLLNIPVPPPPSPPNSFLSNTHTRTHNHPHLAHRFARATAPGGYPAR